MICNIFPNKHNGDDLKKNIHIYERIISMVKICIVECYQLPINSMNTQNEDAVCHKPLKKLNGPTDHYITSIHGHTANSFIRNDLMDSSFGRLPNYLYW